MAKLLVSLAMLVLVFGLALYVFQGGAGVTDAVRNGHDSVLQSVRSFDYVSD
ncbi:hypothetical protein [Paenibacillus sp.]|uniref:hypothetical protein n=1 Tax=Paenibacillus sp. TaxID=58172 RepID=UPI002D35232C|nr:hypothetical protein [Paenibacillus sp.]HZG58274.1 hypothetical protein [Paenibacillus sp.]